MRLGGVRGCPLRTSGRDLQRPSVQLQRPIGERRKPRPEGRPGFIRVDTVHQGDLDGIKGLYHINRVDEVTQFQCVGSVECISEAFLLPVLEALIERFPFRVLGFHADNGSEYINHRVCRLLNKLHVAEFTKSCARRSNDNALVESKNGAVVRKHFGYAHIPGRFAQRVNAFAQNVLSPYLNFHRPCCHIAGIPEGDHQLAQLGHFRQRPANVRGRLQQQKLPLDGLAGPPGLFQGLCCQEPAAAFQAFRCALSDDYLWHSGAAFSSSVPQVFNQARTSCPVRWQPVSL